MNHTKQDRLDALLVSAQIIQRQCKFARVDIENFPSVGVFYVKIHNGVDGYNKFHISKSMSVDDMDKEFSKLEDAASFFEISLREKYL